MKSVKTNAKEKWTHNLHSDSKHGSDATKVWLRVNKVLGFKSDSNLPQTETWFKSFSLTSKTQSFELKWFFLQR